MKIAFDINGTLLRSNPDETKTMVNLLKILKNAGHFIIVWSGEDIEEIIKTVKELKIDGYIDHVMSKLNFDKEFTPEISFDDNPGAFATKAVIKV